MLEMCEWNERMFITNALDSYDKLGSKKYECITLLIEKKDNFKKKEKNVNAKESFW